MIARILTALVLAPMALLAMYFGDIFVLIVVLIAAILTVQEQFVMQIANGYKPHFILSYFLLGGIIFSAFANETSWAWNTIPMALVATCVIGFGFIELFRKNMLYWKSDLYATLRVTFFIGITFSYFILIRSSDNGLFNLIFCCTLTWAGDIFALFGGKLFGKTKLAPSISPKKTIEGSISGTTATFIAAGLYIYFFKLTPLPYLGLTLAISILGQIGDLHESLTKRFFTVKDSSNLLPGHGGVYDRVDSMMFVLPILHYLLLIV